MGEGGGGRRLVCRLTVEDGVGRAKVGGKVGLKLNKLNFNVQTCSTSHVIMSTHDHIHNFVIVSRRRFHHHHRNSARKVPLPSHEGCGPVCMRRERGAKGG